MLDINLIKGHCYSGLSGRYITAEMLAPFLTKLSEDFIVNTAGKSVENRSIKSIAWGKGKCKIFMWSQMHGNESTTTKAVVDLLHFLNTSTSEQVVEWKRHFTFLIVPILNPDGAKAYTRSNANNVDLNRDSVLLSQPESKLLRELFDDFQPTFAFNLHDQRTIFGVGETDLPATISFLAPSFNEACDWNKTRTEAMQVIVEMNKVVQELIPNQVGRFDDSYNINCIGDYFQTRGVPTILFEAGHFQNDYQREKTREIVLFSLFTAIESIYSKCYSVNQLGEYLSISENRQSFVDIILENVFFTNKEDKRLLKIQYMEVLEKENIIFCPIIVGYDEKESKFAHTTIKNDLKFAKSVNNFDNYNGYDARKVVNFFDFEE